MKIHNRKSIFSLLKPYCHLSKEHDFIEVTEWINGEGYDVNISSQLGTILFQITHGEFTLLKKLIKKLDNENT